ncbi:MAG TPA: alpha/beta hydrolase [Gemmatimonadales bacterium]|nr:alpha/beta hydrolase [Gemmatimonadales bacterium]
MIVVLAAALALLGPSDTAVVRDIPVSQGEVLRTTSFGSGRPVVLIPGLFGAAFGYRKIVGSLVEQGYRAIVVEPLGFGWSSHPRRANYSLSAQTARVAAVLDSLEIRKALIVAHSTGGSIALRLAYQRPDLVEGILSIDGGPSESASTPSLRRAMRFGGMLTKALLQPDAVRSEVRHEIVANSSDTTWVTPQVVLGYTDGVTADLPGAIDAWQGMAKSVESESLLARLGECRVPVRLIIGAVAHQSGVGADQIVLLGQRLPDFRVDSVAGSGQYIQEEQPAAVITALEKLVALTKYAVR